MKLNPIDILPDERSTSDDWIAFWNALVKVYGKKSATEAFLKRWSKRGTNGAANVVEVQTGTGLTLSKDIIQSIESTAHNVVSYVGGFFDTIDTTSKIILYGGIGLLGLGVVVVIYRVATISEEGAISIASTAAKII